MVISNRLQDVITHAALSTDNSPVTISISKTKNASMVTVSGNSTVLCFQTKIMLEKQKVLLKS